MTTAIITALAAVFVFFVIVLVHELGHFTVAKLVGVTVHEFAIGMGPRLFKFKKGDTEYSLRALPIGGYVKMEGEDEESNDVGSLNKKPVMARIAVFAAGAFMNFILAILIFSFLTFNSGAILTTTIDKVNEGYPAYKAGLQQGDKIVEIDGKKIETWQETVTEINMSEGNKINFTVERDGELKSYTIKPDSEALEDGNKRFIIGITPYIERDLGFVDIIKSGVQQTFLYIGLMFEFFGRLIQGNVGSNDVAGPVGVISAVGKAAEFGFLNLLGFAGFLSVNLGFINLLPIPALDGSRILFGIIELFRGKPLDPEKEGFIHFIGFVLLMGLVVFITFFDLRRLFGA